MASGIPEADPAQILPLARLNGIELFWSKKFVQQDSEREGIFLRFCLTESGKQTEVIVPRQICSITKLPVCEVVAKPTLSEVIREMVVTCSVVAIVSIVPQVSLFV